MRRADSVNHRPQKKMMTRTLAAVIPALLLMACTATTPYPPVSVPASAPPAADESLFTSDAAVLSDAEIARILSHPYAPPVQSRIALLALGQPQWFSWSDDLARQSEEVRQGVVSQLRTSGAVVSASYLPTFLVPEKRTVGLLREAAARYQADLLLIYRTSCRTYERYRLVRNDQTKAACSVEAALLDVRTGIVPFTTTVSRDYSAVKAVEDVTFEETVRKAELASVADALKEVASRVTTYLGSRATR